MLLCHIAFTDEFISLISYHNLFLGSCLSAFATGCVRGRSWKCGASWTAPWTAAVRPLYPWTDPFASTSSRPPIAFRWARSSGRCSTRCSPLCTSTPAWSPAPHWPTTWVPVFAWPGGWSTRRRPTTWTWTSTWVCAISYNLYLVNNLKT